MTVFFYTTLILLICFLIMVNFYRIRLLNEARRRGKLPKKGKATMFDVRHLLMEGDKELATQVYSEIFNVSLTRAKKDVEELQKSLKV